MPVKECPACKSSVPAEAEDCPNCPMSFRQAESTVPRRSAVRALGENPLIKTALVVGALWGAWTGVNWLVDGLGAEGEQSPFAFALKDGRLDLRQVDSVSTLRAEAAIKGEAPRLEGSPKLTLKEDAEEPGGGEITVSAPAEPARGGAAAEPEPEPEEVVREWRLRGKVYDLVSLKPLSGCQMVFADPETNSRYETSTDGSGAYRLVVPPLSRRGYLVTIRHPDFAPSYLNPGKEDVRDMKDADRKSLADDLARSLDAPYTVQAVGSRPLITDFYLAPRR